MQSGLYDLTLEQGADWWMRFRWLTDQGPVDLTGFDAHMQIRSDAASETVLLDLRTGGRGITIDPAASAVWIGITAAQLNAIRYPGAREKIWAARRQLVHLGDYDIQLISSLGERTRMLGGKVFLSPGVTR